MLRLQLIAHLEFKLYQDISFFPKIEVSNENQLYWLNVKSSELEPLSGFLQQKQIL